MATVETTIFKRGSTTYYWSSVFFPREVRADIFKLYSFVRTVDDLVDVVPPRRAEFQAVYNAWEASKANPPHDHARTLQKGETRRALITKNIAELSVKYNFDPAWVQAFFSSMQADLDGARYKTLAQTLGYVHGSAEVIGLMLAQIMRLPPTAGQAAMLQGRAMQWINFVRDIAEDNALGRSYFPQEDLRHFGLSDVQEATARAHPEQFAAFIRFELGRYTQWQAEATSAHALLPRRVRTPVATAAHMYGWTAQQIAKDPFIVFARKVKPSRRRVLATGFGTALALLLRRA